MSLQELKSIHDVFLVKACTGSQKKAQNSIWITKQENNYFSLLKQVRGRDIR